MMVKVEEEPAPELPPAAYAGPYEHYSPQQLPVDAGDDYEYDDDDDEEEDEETDDEGDGGGARRSGDPPLKKGPWTPEEDKRLMDYVYAHGEGNWNQVRINAGLNRCGKSCRLRWSNHLRPDLKKGPFDDEEVEKIIRMHMSWGNKWAKMAALLPGRTDNEIKNYWNTRLKRHQRAGLPIYPEYLVSQASNQDMNFETPEEPRGIKRNELSQGSVLEIHDLFNEYFDHNAFSKLMPNVGALPSSSLAVPNAPPIDALNPLKRHKSTGCIQSDYNGVLSILQISDGYEKAGCSTSFNYGMTENQLAPLGDAIISGHPVFDGNPSTSWARPMKMELPSVQYSNYGTSNAWVCDRPLGSPIEQVNTLIESPGSLKSESISPRNTGMDSIVHKVDEIDDPIKSQGIFEEPVPFSHNQVSQSIAYTMRHSFSPVPGDEIVGCPLGEIHSKSPSNAIFSEINCYPDTGKYPSSWAEVGVLDASLEASFFNEAFPKDQSIYNDGYSCGEAKQSNADHGLFAWKSMPSACNMPDLSNQ